MSWTMAYFGPIIAGTMFELVNALEDGKKTMARQVPNPIGLNGGSDMLIAFVTLFPHEATVSTPLFSPSVFLTDPIPRPSMHSSWSLFDKAEDTPPKRSATAKKSPSLLLTLSRTTPWYVLR